VTGIGNQSFGVDVGGSGIKGGRVDLDAGALNGERLRIQTPDPSAPEAVAEVIVEIVQSFDWRGPLGVALPCVVQAGVARTAANIHQDWIGTDAAKLLTTRIGERVLVINDADAAAIAEMRYGAGRDVTGVTVLLTFGTGIGSAVFAGGTLVPNTELGHLQLDGRDAEDIAAAAVRDELGLSWPEWATRVTTYLRALETVIWPDLIIVGGGVSKRAGKWLPLLGNRTPVVPAALRNDAGIIGAALAAAG
jgi:polyphosphate glucokinase